MKISVIIPVFNSEKYLRECIESVLRQTYKNIEILLINDGSKDNSGKICDEYAVNDSRVVVFHTANNGQARARNIAIEKATGEYIAFLDSDDYWLCDSFIDEAVELLKESNADILSFEYGEFFSEKERPVAEAGSHRKGSCPRSEVFGLSAGAALTNLLKQPPLCFSTSIINKMVKTDFLKQNNIRFPDSKNKCEDVYFSAKTIMYAKTYDRYDKVVYAVRRANLSSDTARPETKLIILQSMTDVFTSLFSEMDNSVKRLPQDIYAKLMDLLSSAYAYWLGMVVGAKVHAKKEGQPTMLDEDINKSIETMRQYAFVLNYASRSNVKLLGIFYKLFGINITLFFLRIYLSLNRKNKLSINRDLT